MKIRILHIYPDLLNLYGDKGNIAALTHRLTWRGIDSEVICYNGGELNLEEADIVFIGGGSDRDEKLVCEKLYGYKALLSEYAENGGVVIAVCGGFAMLGDYYCLSGEKVLGLGVLDMYSEPSADRITGDVVLESDLVKSRLVGFENRTIRTVSDKYERLGTAICGKDDSVVYKNLIGTHMYGPLLPKNPKLCDYILTRALEKYEDFKGLTPLDDSSEKLANETIVKRYVK